MAQGFQWFEPLPVAPHRLFLSRVVDPTSVDLWCVASAGEWSPSPPSGCAWLLRAHLWRRAAPPHGPGLWGAWALTPCRVFCPVPMCPCANSHSARGRGSHASTWAPLDDRASGSLQGHVPAAYLAPGPMQRARAHSGPAFSRHPPTLPPTTTPASWTIAGKAAASNRGYVGYSIALTKYDPWSVRHPWLWRVYMGDCRHTQANQMIFGAVLVLSNFFLQGRDLTFHASVKCHLWHRHKRLNLQRSPWENCGTCQRIPLCGQPRCCDAVGNGPDFFVSMAVYGHRHKVLFDGTFKIHCDLAHRYVIWCNMSINILVVSVTTDKSNVLQDAAPE